MRNLSVLLALALALALALNACSHRKDGDGTSPGAKPDAAHSSHNSLDWAGVYEGMLRACAMPSWRTSRRLPA